MQSIELPGYYTTLDAMKIKKHLEGKSYMSFKIEFGGYGNQNQTIIVSTNSKVTKKELRELFYFVLIKTFTEVC